ncbi:hypothetical protein ACFSUD_06390 [Sulfitobacter aestuarii]|uniref:Pilus assembly protein n=1 Tax=Sulfitobacter aestuarii TaxID=2161676 RepID=A0ABW5TZV4_9RHOB
MRRFLKFFARSQNGAMTVDWIVLTAAAVALPLLTLSFLEDTTVAMLKELGDTLVVRFASRD